MYDDSSLFKLAFDASSIGMALVSTEGKFLKVNKSLCDLVGYSEEEILQKTFQDITYADDLASDLALMNRCLSGELDWYNMEKRYLTKDNKIVWILLTGSIVRNDQKKPVVFLAHIQDITDIKLYKERLDLALGNWGIGVWTWYADKDKLIWDKAMFNLFETTEEEFSGTYAFFEQFVHPDDKADVAKKVQEALDNHSDFRTRFRIVSKNGTCKWISGLGRISVDSVGSVYMMTGINMDVSSDVLTECELESISKRLMAKADNITKNIPTE